MTSISPSVPCNYAHLYDIVASMEWEHKSTILHSAVIVSAKSTTSYVRSVSDTCPTLIHLIQPGAYVRENGQPTLIENAICIHEEDAGKRDCSSLDKPSKSRWILGILWKHTDFRKGGRAHTVRSRRLVISMICTVANYGSSPLPSSLNFTSY